MDLALTNVVNVSVSATPIGANAYNTSNLALFSSETPGSGFPSNGYQLYLTPSEVATDFGSNSITYQMALAIFSQNPNILAGGGYLVIIELQSSETLAAAITRTQSLVQYFGCMSMQIEGSTDANNAALVVASLNKVLFIVEYATASIMTNGIFPTLTAAGYSNTRGLYYGDSSNGGLNALLFMAGYASRALSVDFLGSNTTLTMHLKQIVGTVPDPTMTQTYLNDALIAGADTYPSLQGVPGVFCSGANKFFDQVYNVQWLAGALQVAGFNYLQQTSTKVPQTEAGMDGLKGAYIAVLQQAVVNGYAAPGTWTSPVTFGNQAALVQNIAQQGWYIYSAPIATQLPTARVARQAPLVQIALKEAGAIQSSNVIVNVNP